jgi:CMP-N-acetylneuraminic acid synthetase
MSVIALIPARQGSKGVPGKNWKHLPSAGGSKALFLLACDCAWAAGVDRVVVSSDRHRGPGGWQERFVPIVGMTGEQFRERVSWLDRPPDLAQDDTPMLAVVQHALQQIPGEPDDIIVLLQPTQPLRTPQTVRKAIEALTEDWDSVVTIAPIPRSHAPDFSLVYCNTTLGVSPHFGTWAERPTRRQDAMWPYIADGTAYVFRRRTVKEHGNIYGELVRGLIIPPEDTCELDTEADWAALLKRWESRKC